MNYFTLTGYSLLLALAPQKKRSERKICICNYGNNINHSYIWQKIVLFTSILLFSLSFKLTAQNAYFVDGYHGGIYGHYPQWVTQFMIDQLEKHPQWKIGLEIEPETWDTVLQLTPHTYQYFKKIAGGDRIEFTNPTYAQPYCYNISGESLIRHFQYGMHKIQTHFPDVEFTTYAVEEPCFTSALPQILKFLGFKYAVLKCPDTCWGGYTRAYGRELINWIGSDGTSILTVPRYASEKLEKNSTWQTMAWRNSDDYLKTCYDYGIKKPVGMCYQDAGWNVGPWIGYGDSIMNNSKYITWKEYFEKISAGKTNDNWKFTQEDILVNLMWGSQVLQQIAQSVRIAENKIVIAEKMGAMANLSNGFQTLQQDTDNAWRSLMLSQHHDSWIVPYNIINNNQTWAEKIEEWTDNTIHTSNTVINQSINSFAVNNMPDQNGYIRVYNTTADTRSEVVKIKLPENFNSKNISIYNSTGKQIPCYVKQEKESSYILFTASVPSFGYSTYSITESSDFIEQPTDFVSVIPDSDGNYILENDMYKLTLDLSRGGIIKSLVAKAIGNKDLVDPDNTFCMGELRGYFYDDEKFYSSAESKAKIKVLEDNPFEIKVKIDGHIASHHYVQIITLRAGQEQIDFELNIDWKNNVGIGEYKQGENWVNNRRAFTDDRYKLNVMFPTSLSSARLYKNAPFDVCESRLDNTHFSTWDSIKHNVILNWVDLVQEDGKYGLSVFSDHTTSYSYGSDFPLGITVQYSGIGLWGKDYDITKPSKLTYAISPHSGKWDEATVHTQSVNWNEPLIPVYYEKATPEDKSFVSFDKSGYEITTVKKEGNDILIRIFNGEGNEHTYNMFLDFIARSAEEINLKGETISREKISEKNSIAMNIPRFGIKTFLIKK